MVVCFKNLHDLFLEIMAFKKNAIIDFDFTIIGTKKTFLATPRGDFFLKLPRGSATHYHGSIFVSMAVGRV